MSSNRDEWIWHNGKLIPYDQAQVHVLTHALHYGSSVFEGIRVYKTPDGPKIFRLADHVQRLYDSARIYRMPIPYEFDELHAVCKEIIVANDLMNGAIRALRTDCLYNTFLSAHMAVIRANYIDVHTQEDLDAVERRYGSAQAFAAAKSAGSNS